MTTDLEVLGTATALEEYRPRIVMAPEQARELDEALRANMRAVLREGDDYGVIPGTSSTKPTLLKSGSEKLLQWFGFGHEMQRTEIERDADGNKVGVTYRCVVTKSLPAGLVVTTASCEGYAGYDEDRFFTSALAAEQRERANAQRYQRAPNPTKMVEHRAPWNTVIKMAQKRALVGAALQACGASSLFTQDMEDQAPAAPPPAIAPSAMRLVKELPEDTRSRLNEWCQSQGWPTVRRDWTVENWCLLLFEAGQLVGSEPSWDKNVAEDVHAKDAIEPAVGSEPFEAVVQ